MVNFFKVREVRHMYCCNGVVAAVNKCNDDQ